MSITLVINKVKFVPAYANIIIIANMVVESNAVILSHLFNYHQTPFQYINHFP